MTPEQEADINNALLTLMYEWKRGIIDQDQALKEFKQCLKYYSRMEDVMQFEDNRYVDAAVIEDYGYEKVVEKEKRRMVENMISGLVASNCLLFEEVEISEPQPFPRPIRRFRMKMQAIIQSKNERN